MHHVIPVFPLKVGKPHTHFPDFWNQDPWEEESPCAGHSATGGNIHRWLSKFKSRILWDVSKPLNGLFCDVWLYIFKDMLTRDNWSFYRPTGVGAPISSFPKFCPVRSFWQPVQQVSHIKCIWLYDFHISYFTVTRLSYVVLNSTLIFMPLSIWLLLSYLFPREVGCDPRVCVGQC